jgi:RNA polymerase-binding protein DksA
MATAKKAPAKKATATKAKAAAKPAAKKAAPAKGAAKKAAPTKKAAPAKSTAKKAAPAKAAAKKPAAKPAPAKKSTTKSSSAKVTTSSKSPAASKSSAPAKKSAATSAPAKAAAKQTAPAKAAAKKAEPVKVEKAAKVKAVKETPVVVAPPAPPVQVINPIGGVISSVRKAVPGKKLAPKHPVVQEDESNWTKTEINQVRKVLEKEKAELLADIAEAEEKFHELIVASGEGAGDDQADAGTKTFEREQEISLLSNKRDMLDQTNHALERIEAGTYGLCETCGRHIGKLRLMEANPRATLCMPCRQREDRS